jgi:hypothetical protein
MDWWPHKQYYSVTIIAPKNRPHALKLAVNLQPAHFQWRQNGKNAAAIVRRDCPSTPLRDHPSAPGFDYAQPTQGPPLQAVAGVPTCHQKYPYATQPCRGVTIIVTPYAMKWHFSYGWLVGTPTMAFVLAAIWRSCCRQSMDDWCPKTIPFPYLFFN